jgi:Ca2+-binding RTX toxin-like protein
VLDGGAGDDRLNGGYDADVVRGGPGDDRIVARGGGIDRITCGPGVDTVIADSRDGVDGSCERVRRSGGAPGTAVSAAGTRR